MPVEEPKEVVRVDITASIKEPTPNGPYNKASSDVFEPMVAKRRTKPAPIAKVEAIPAKDIEGMGSENASLQWLNSEIKSLPHYS